MQKDTHSRIYGLFIQKKILNLLNRYSFKDVTTNIDRLQILQATSNILMLIIFAIVLESKRQYIYNIGHTSFLSIKYLWN